MATEAEAQALVAESKRVTISPTANQAPLYGYAVAFQPASLTIQIDGGGIVTASIADVTAVPDATQASEVEAQLLEAVGDAAEGRALLVELRERGITLSKVRSSITKR